MSLKYLKGVNRFSLEEVMVFTVKDDIYQHIDMARETSIEPEVGGFAYFFEGGSKVRFHGESISCRVKTRKSSFENLFNRFDSNGVKYFKVPVLIMNRIFDTIVAVPKGCDYSNQGDNQVSISFNEANELLDEQLKTLYWYKDCDIIESN